MLMDPDLIEPAISARTKAILPVHLYGPDLPGELRMEGIPAVSNPMACYVAAGFDRGGLLQDVQHGPGSVVVTED